MGQGSARRGREALTHPQTLLELAIEAAHQAGEILLAHYASDASGIDTKTSATDPVSDADRAAEERILDLIASQRPQDGVLAEEGGQEDSSSGLTWVVDPLDGTVNFLYRIPLWGISIAVEDPYGGLVGVIHDPNRGETFSAIRGRGAQMNARPIRVSEQTSLAQALIGTGFSYDADARAIQAELARRILPRARDIRRGGSAALDLAALACGRLDAFYEAPMEPWDKAAGVLIATEAGAVFSELAAPKAGLSPGLIGANWSLHDRVRELLIA